MGRCSFGNVSAMTTRHVFSFLHESGVGIMKTQFRIAMLSVVTFGMSFGLMGCGEDNNNSSMTLPDGTKATGKPANNAPRNSMEAYEKQKQNSPTNSAEYKKAMGH